MPGQQKALGENYVQNNSGKWLGSENNVLLDYDITSYIMASVYNTT